MCAIIKPHRGGRHHLMAALQPVATAATSGHADVRRRPGSGPGPRGVTSLTILRQAGYSERGDALLPRSLLVCGCGPGGRPQQHQGAMQPAHPRVEDPQLGASPQGLLLPGPVEHDVHVGVIQRLDGVMLHRGWGAAGEPSAACDTAGQHGELLDSVATAMRACHRPAQGI